MAIIKNTELVDIVDENDNVITSVPRYEMRQKHLPHRATYVACVNCEGKFLVELRTLNKDYAPGKFDACIGGVVAHDEDPIAGVARELEEEVGIRQSDLDYHYLGKKKYALGQDSFFYAYLVLAKGNKITVRQQSELSAVLYLSYEEIMALKDNFTKDSLQCLEEILDLARSKDLI